MTEILAAPTSSSFRSNRPVLARAGSMLASARLARIAAWTLTLAVGGGIGYGVWLVGGEVVTLGNAIADGIQAVASAVVEMIQDLFRRPF